MTNNFELYDKFELQTAGTAHNYIYDFSQSSANFANKTTNNSSWYIKNKTFSTTNMTTVSGDTGVRNIVFGDPELNNNYGPVFIGTTVTGGVAVNGTLTSDFSLISDNGNDKTLPIITDNVYVDLSNNTTNTANTFRSGYIELSFKTNKANSTLASGTGTGATAAYRNISGTNYIADTQNSGTSSFSINIVDGKLNVSYVDEYGINATSFSINSNKTVSDDIWHHVIINITRPGLQNNDFTYSEDRAIEIWIDSKLDKRDTESINNKQIVFPIVTRLFGEYSFSGLFRTFAQRINYPLIKNEIEQHYAYWNYDGENSAKRSVKLGSMTAILVEPSVSVNKKRALKLFWNNIQNKNGIELDDNYIVNSYSVTHKNKNSVTETHNVDLANKKTYSILTNVRVAIKSNIMLWGPGSALSSAIIPSQINPANISAASTSSYAGSVLNMTFGGVKLISGDRILLTNQVDYSENGIWIFNGEGNPLSRPTDANSPQKISNAIVYVTEGYETDSYWTLDENVSSFSQPQSWTKLNGKPEDTILSQPFLVSKWSKQNGEDRFIDLENDIDISQFDVIVFMNYPEKFDDIRNNFPNDGQIKIKYDKFIDSLRNVVTQGASLYVSSPLLAADLGIINDYGYADQATEDSDAQSAAINPFEFGETADQYFDTHRINQYSLVTEIPGLTDKATYVLTDFINYTPTDANIEEQYHAKYAYKPLGLKEGTEFFIPSLALRKITEKSNIAGYAQNRRGTSPIAVLEPWHINTGTPVTQMQNNYYVGSTPTNNPHDDDVTSLVVHEGQLLNGQPVLGKIFVNFAEDGYTMSREEYNKAVIQVLPNSDISETAQTRAWQYSTSRLNRLPKRSNISQLTEFGQTTPTNGGGGAFIQAPSNSSNGVIRSKTDLGNANYQSDLYPTEAEEIYPTQEIPVLSMTWLGLQWLAE